MKAIEEQRRRNFLDTQREWLRQAEDDLDRLYKRSEQGGMGIGRKILGPNIQAATRRVQALRRQIAEIEADIEDGAAAPAGSDGEGLVARMKRRKGIVS